MIFFQHSSEHFSKNSAFSIIHTNKGTALHWHNAVEFMFIVNGGLHVTLNGEEYLAVLSNSIIDNIIIDNIQ